jgi:FtsH-binding integral membrane protein
MAALMPHRDDWLDQHSAEWVRSGLLTPEQADAIRLLEASAVPKVRLPIVAEVAAYLGSVLALMAGGVVVVQQWDEITVVGRAALGVVIALTGFLAGRWMIRIDEPGSRRLGGFLWTLGVGGVALTCGVVADHLGLDAGEEDGSLLLAIGVPVLAVGVGLWRNLDRPLQLLSAWAGVAITLVGIGQEIGIETWEAGLVTWAAGVSFGVVALWGPIRPRTFALVVATAVAWFGAMVLIDWNERLAPPLAALTAAAAVAVGIRDELLPVLVVGVLGFLSAIQALLSTTFSGAGSSMIVALIGVAVVVWAVMRAQSTRDGSDNARTPVD